MLSEAQIIAAWKEAGYLIKVSHRRWSVTKIVKEESDRWMYSSLLGKDCIGHGACGTKSNTHYMRRRKNLQAAVKCATLHRIKK